MIPLPVPHGLVKHPDRGGKTRGAIGSLVRGVVQAVDASDADPPGADRLDDTTHHSTSLNISLGGGEYLDLGTNEAHQWGQVGLVGWRVQRDVPSFDSTSTGSRGGCYRG